MTSTAQAPVVGRRRIAGRVALVAAVLVMHTCVMRSINDSVIDFDQGKKPARIELVPVQDMAFSAPPVPAAATPPPPAPATPPRRPRQATPVAAVASAPAVAASAPNAEPVLAAVQAESPASAPDPVGAEPAEPAVAAVAAPAASLPTVAAAAPASAADAFGWPPSTRITYELTGNYRGEVYGSAQVDWVHVGERYQVHLDVSVAVVFSIRMSSDGRLSDVGLVPERFDQEIKAPFRDRKRASVTLDADTVVLSNGLRFERMPGVQDQASQFVQLTYLFTRHPELLKPGGTIDLPLALPRRLSVWTYDIRESEPVYTSFGAIDAIPLQPRRESRKGDELSATVWFAPSLKYLPVRIRIQQDTETYIDLMIKRRPQLAQ
jgi:hypothetical protein